MEEKPGLVAPFHARQKQRRILPLQVSKCSKAAELWQRSLRQVCWRAQYIVWQVILEPCSKNMMCEILEDCIKRNTHRLSMWMSKKSTSLIVCRTQVVVDDFDADCLQEELVVIIVQVFCYCLQRVPYFCRCSNHRIAARIPEGRTFSAAVLQPRACL